MSQENVINQKIFIYSTEKNFYGGYRYIILPSTCLFVVCLLGLNVPFDHFSVILRQYALGAVQTQADFLGAASLE